jgi:ribosomal protein RSM22 (predicted rRNA methylase)
MNDALQASATAWLEAQPGALRASTAAMASTYRQGKTSATVDITAYVTARMPATYAAVAAVLARLKEQAPGLAPLSLLDLGCGPGTASWAAASAFPTLECGTLMDSDRRFLDLARTLGVAHPLLRQADYAETDLRRLAAPPQADLAIAAYSLTELAAAEAEGLVARVWPHVGQALVIVEPGTPQGFERIRQLRRSLVGQGAQLLAPCPHAGECPIRAPDWCHFKVRLPRRRAHLHAKAASVPFEDESYAYLIAARAPAETPAPRIIGPPLSAKPGMTFPCCTATGLVRSFVARRDKPAYKRARKCVWGDLLRLSNETDGEH